MFHQPKVYKTSGQSSMSNIEQEKQCPFLTFSSQETPTLKEVLEKLEKGNEKQKVFQLF